MKNTNITMIKDTYYKVTSRLPKEKMGGKDLQFKFPKSGKKEDIIDWIIYTQFVDNYTIQLMQNNDFTVDDVIQDIYLVLLEKSQEDWDKLTAQGFSVIRSYISGLIYRDVMSKNSRSYYKYRKYNHNKVSLDDSFCELADKSQKY